MLSSGRSSWVAKSPCHPIGSGRSNGAAWRFRVGAVRIKELLGWCDQAGIKHVTLYLLATDNLQRPAAELDPLVKIIEDLATELAEDGNPWRLRIVGALDVLPAPTATVLKAAQERIEQIAFGADGRPTGVTPFDAG